MIHFLRLKKLVAQVFNNFYLDEDHLLDRSEGKENILNGGENISRGKWIVMVYLLEGIGCSVILSMSRISYIRLVLEKYCKFKKPSSGNQDVFKSEISFVLKRI